MANAEGGLIVIGVATMKDPAIAGDVAGAVDPCKSPPDLVQVKSVLSSWLFPPQNVGLTARTWGPEVALAVLAFEHGKVALLVSELPEQALGDGVLAGRRPNVRRHGASLVEDTDIRTRVSCGRLALTGKWRVCC